MTLVNYAWAWTTDHVTVLAVVVSAIAAVLIASFTYTLARSTDKLWKAGEKQIALGEKAADAARTAADAANRQATSMVAIELPIFVIKDVQIIDRNHRRGIEIKIGNHGRTPAIITADCLEIRAEKALPRKPRYTAATIFPVLRDKIVECGQIYSFVREIPFSDEEWNEVANGKTTLWAYGYVDYLDFVKRGFREGYCIAFLAKTGGGLLGGLSWVRSGNSNYTYNRHKTEDD